MVKHKIILLKPIFKKLIVIVYVFIGIIIFYHIYFARKIIPGVRVGSVDVGGMNFQTAKKAVEDYSTTKVKDLTLTYSDKEYTIKSTDISLVYDWDGSVSRAFEVGRTGNVLVDTKDKLAGIFKTLYIGA